MQQYQYKMQQFPLKENGSENVCKMAAVLSQPQYVKYKSTYLSNVCVIQGSINLIQYKEGGRLVAENKQSCKVHLTHWPLGDLNEILSR